MDSITANDRRRWKSWLVLSLIIFCAALALGYIWLIQELSFQQRNIRSMVVGVGAFLLGMVWVLFLSPLHWRARLWLLGGIAGLLGLLLVLFPIRGVTGDVLPIFRWRWARTAPGVESSVEARPSTLLESTVSESNSVPAYSFPQFMGPDRNCIVRQGPKLARDWSRQPPRRLWRQPIGPAWSGFAVAGHHAVTLEQRGGQEAIVGYDLLTGKVRWLHQDEARYFTTLAGEGPRTTPTIAGDRVVTLGATGILNCLELATGKLVWSKNCLVENQSAVSQWGVAGSPLVLSNLVMVNPGGKNGRSLVAYRLATGEFVWGGGDDAASYSSPYADWLGGVRQVLIFNQHAIFGHEVATGKELWRSPWPSGHPHVALPVVLPGDQVLVSSGYGVGSELLQIQVDGSGKFSAHRRWKTTRLKSKFNNLVVQGGFVYGLDDGTLTCLDLVTGQPRWREGRYGHGQFILAGDVLLLTAENGEVVLLEPSPVQRRELGKLAALEGKTWNPPALAGDLLLVRNDREAACYRLPLAETKNARP